MSSQNTNGKCNSDAKELANVPCGHRVAPHLWAPVFKHPDERVKVFDIDKPIPI